MKWSLKKSLRGQKIQEQGIAHLHAVSLPHFCSCLWASGWNLQTPGERVHDNRLRVRFHRSDGVAAMFDQLSINLCLVVSLSGEHRRRAGTTRIKLRTLG